MNKKSILYFDSSPLMKNGIMDGFKKCGFDVKLFDITCIGRPYMQIISNNNIVIVEYNKPNTQQIINEYIEKCVLDSKPNYIFVAGDQEEIVIASNYVCKKYNIKFIYWNIEDPTAIEKLTKQCLLADVVFTTTVERIIDYKKIGIDAKWLMFACNPEYHTSGIYKKEYDLDFVIQASWYNWADRINGMNIVLKPLLNISDNFKIYGWNWDTNPLAINFMGNKVNKYNGILPNSEIPDLCASSKFVLGMQCNAQTSTQMSMRAFEILSSSINAIHLTQWTPAFDNWFCDKVHLLTTKSQEETLEKYNYFSSHDKERKSIVEFGRNFVHKYHTYEIRVKENILPYI